MHCIAIAYLTFTFYNFQIFNCNFHKQLVFVRVKCGCDTDGTSAAIQLYDIFFNIQKSLWNDAVSTYVLGFLIVPLRRLILVIMSKSLNRKNPRSFRPPCPCGIDTKSNDKKCRSLDTKSEMFSMTPWLNEKNKYFESNLHYFFSTWLWNYLLQVREGLLLVGHFPALHVLYNSNAAKCHAPISELLVTFFDRDVHRRYA